MPSIKDLKKRIVSVKSTQQTTRAMKMVSAAKLRRAQEAILSQRPFAKKVLDLIFKLEPDINRTGEAILGRKPQLSESATVRRVLLVLVTSDRGLCGAFNSNVIKAGQRWIQSHVSEAQNVELAFVGKRGFDYFKNRPLKVAGYFPEWGGKVTFLKAKGLSELLMKRYLSSEVDEIKIIYNEFKNAMSQKVVVENFLPLQLASEETGSQAASGGDYLVKPSQREVLLQLLNKSFSIQAYRILLESQAGEHGSRMSAMENATKNAGEMIRKLTLQYNKQRQAGITKELLEIISGSESQKG